MNTQSTLVVSRRKQFASYEDKPLPVLDVPARHLTPGIQALSELGITTKDWEAISDANSPLAKRVARAWKVGGWSLTESESLAIDLLGTDRVLLAPDVAEVQDQSPQPFSSRKIPYSAETLRQASLANEHDKAEWRLTYCLGLSPRQVLGRVLKAGLHVDSEHQSAISMWEKYYRSTYLAGYYLVDWTMHYYVKENHQPYRWDEQEDEIAKLPEQTLRAPAAMMLETWASYALVTGHPKWNQYCCLHGTRIETMEEGPQKFLSIYPGEGAIPRVRVCEEKEFHSGVVLLRKPDF
ncbi:MAG TPA: hypothetical protein VJH55_02815 [Candidatus Paceibacterota bacterium]